MSYIGRLAPSPTGAQHLGNARTYLVAWLHARTAGGTLRLRIEDLDTPRTKVGAEAQVFSDLQWLGLDWDQDDSALGFLRQSDRSDRYHGILKVLQSKELVYPCTCSRSEIESSSSAPHESFLDGAIYSGKCSSRSVVDANQLDAQGIRYAWRFRLTHGQVAWSDEFAGPQSLDPGRLLGDFVVARNYGPIAYQLAVVVDDHDSGITHVVRGHDLIYSTYRQLALYEALGWRAPAWLHLPLVVGKDGRRLAKRHGDTRLSTYREHGVHSETMIATLAHSLGLTPTTEPISASDLLDIVRERPNWLLAIPKVNVEIDF